MARMHLQWGSSVFNSFFMNSVIILVKPSMRWAMLRRVGIAWSSNLSNFAVISLANPLVDVFTFSETWAKLLVNWRTRTHTGSRELTSFLRSSISLYRSQADGLLLT
jgi:hypothetical protein